MLFSYTYVPHQIEKMQAFIDFIFYEIWCKAPMSGPFGFHLFKSNAELHEVMKVFYYSDKKNADFFYGSIERIYNHFAYFKKKQIRRMKWWYYSNNNIALICSNNSGIYAARYSDVQKKYSKLFDDLKRFFTGLYDFDSAVLSAKIGHINDHYQAFVNVNKTGKCPFCGIGDIKGRYHTKREAYDHYLPEAIYPFNSINFYNLAPACHECNSTYKLSKDPAYNNTVRRKAFNPYTTAGHTIEIQVTLHHADVDILTPADITIQLGPTMLAEELETWKNIYGIEERYKAKICEENDGKYWLTQVLEECKAYNKQPSDILNMRATQAQTNPYADCNFLRKPFLEACERVGLFDI